MEITLPAVFFAGMLSFLTPCVLPLVPAYLSFLAGATLDEMAAEEPDRVVVQRALVTSLLFVLGFGTVFVLLGATASALGGLIRQHLDWLTMFAGIGIIVMGLHFLGVFRIDLLYREARFNPSKPVGLWGGYAMGLAFGFGWTPCIGPVLAAVLTVAAAEATVVRGAGLLAVYAAGLGLPFLLAAFAMGPFTGFLARFRRHLGRVEQVIGVLLILVGIAFLTGWITQMSFWLLETFPALGRLG
ncbi:cytochrome c biogenesis CcdA family protein [Terrihabitans sp. B22-R8]|uniref:cytochrome c biogenesis CcdA family protein n=1 Tax=Terrihabitans sp. B22-R8 TaxID=3425128 RepID=UPI00403CAB21